MTDGLFQAYPSDDDWQKLYQMARQQSLVGVLYMVASRQRMPLEIAMQWASEAEQLRGLNHLMNDQAAMLTEEFRSKGLRTVILKGQANARLYPDPLSRQPGDIDIWAEGGRKKVMALLGVKSTLSYHHVHLPANEKGVVVEVHFRPSSGNYNPLTNRRLQRWLEQEILPATKVEENFYVPSIRFALVMQLSHIQRHFLSSGVGLRQVCDYYQLLRHASEEELREVAVLIAPFGLRHIGEALMWVLREIFGLEDGLMLCAQDSYRGEWLLREILEGGNFGTYSSRMRTDSDIVFFLRKMKRHLQLARFVPMEMLFLELDYWKGLFKRIPERIRHRRFSLRSFPE